MSLCVWLFMCAVGQQVLCYFHKACPSSTFLSRVVGSFYDFTVRKGGQGG